MPHDAKYNRGTVAMHVGPKFSRPSARSDFHVPLRSGTGITFLRGMIHYILENRLYFQDYVANANKVRQTFDNLDRMVAVDVHHSETSDNWRRPGVDSKTVKSEVFLLPSAHRLDKAGSVTNSGRWMLWHYDAVKPPGQARTFGDMFIDLAKRVRSNYAPSGRRFSRSHPQHGLA